MQATSCNSRLLDTVDTLDVKSRVIAFDLSTLLAAALGRLERRAWHSAQVYSNVQLEVDLHSMVDPLSTDGAHCTPPYSPGSLFT